MGIWSATLFARVSTGSPDDYIIDRSTWDRPHSDHPGWDGFFDTTSTDRPTLTQFMASSCNTLKIYNYMDPFRTQAWIHMSQKLLSAYPALTWVQYHFYCSDESIPFYFEYRHNDPENLSMFVGSADSLHYKRRRTRTWGEWWAGFSHEEVESLTFIPALYRQNLFRIDFRPVRLRTIPTLIDSMLA